MKTKIKKSGRKLMAFLLSVLTLFITMMSAGDVVVAADGTINFTAGKKILYGDYFTTRMTVDGFNTAYCVEPMKKVPQTGTYEYNLLYTDSPLRKALFYLQGGYGYDGHIKNQYLSGWSEDDAYVIGHLVVAYIYAGYSADSGAFYGAPQNYIDKALEVTNAIKGLPNPPKSYRAFIVPANSSQTIAGSWYEVPYGWIELQKSTANGSVSDGNGTYSLAGAKYGIFNGNQQVATLTTDKNGYAKSEKLEILENGHYTVKELQASPGYALDVNGYDVEVKADTISSVKVKEVPQNNPLDILLQKVDAETQEGVAQGAAALKDAEFTVKYYLEQSDSDPAASGKKPARTWVFKTDESGSIHFTKDYLVSGDELYYQLDGATPCVPLGTITVQESKSPEGYLMNEQVFVQKITGSGTAETVKCYNAPKVPEQVYRGDLEFVKVSDGELNRLANIPFAITSKTTGESHTIVADKNGYASTSAKWNKHTNHTNRGETSEDGIWFGSSEPDDAKGALIYDTYTIEEQRCKENEGMSLLKFDVTVYKDSVTIDLGTLTDDKIEIATTAIDKETGDHISNPDEKVVLIDTVEYEGLKKGKEYKVIGILMNQKTGDPVLVNGEKVTSEKIFKAKKSTGSVEVEFVFDGSALKGTTITVFEELYQDDLKLAVHADINDTDQMVYFPEIGTTARDSETGENISKADEEVTLVDTVTYKNLIPGKEYKVIGTLMDKETEKELLINDQKVTAEAAFTPEESSGEADVTFVFDGNSVQGKTLVVFETVQYEGKDVAVHADIEDEGQTVHFPSVQTTASDSETNNHVSAPDQEVTIVDIVTYENLIPGKEYKVTGTLMNKEDGKPLEIAGEQVKPEVVFIPKESSGTIELSFTFDGSGLEGQTIVAFESITYQETEIAVHTDIEDTEQSIYFPEIKTTAKDGADGEKELKASAKVTIVDTVSYNNLEAGKKYKVVGTLMDKATNKELLIGGKPVIAEATFETEKSEGTVDVTFNFDGTGLEEYSIVVFEKLYDVSGEKEVFLTSHEDMEDEGQTVKFVKKEVPKTPNVDTPKTGDDSHVGIWIALSVIAVAGIAVFGILTCRKRKNK